MIRSNTRKLILTHNRAPGDIVVLTALIRDIALTYPGRFQIDVETSAMDLWRHNPYLTRLRPTGGKPASKDIEYVKLDYGHGIREQKHTTMHFLSCFHKDFATRTHVQVPVHLPYPDLHLSEDERTRSPLTGRYWLFIAGGKNDYPIKIWDHQSWTKVVALAAAEGINMVQIGSTDTGHWHPRIPGAFDLVGQTNLRDMLRLIWHADGVVCGITAAMHCAASLQRPCVVVAGGREAVHWEGYVNEHAGFGPLASGKVLVPHRYLHTTGLLECAVHGGCWKNRVLESETDKSVCKMPVIRPGQATAHCLTMISPSRVLDAMLSYYLDGTLPRLPDTHLAEEMAAVENSCV